MLRLTSALLLMLPLAPVASQADVSDGGKARPNAPHPAVSRALSEALEQEGLTRIEVTLDLTAKVAADLDHPAAGSDVHPRVFDIAMLAGPGPLRLDQVGTLHRLHVAATQASVGEILQMKEVVAVHLDTEPVRKAPVLAKGLCQPSTNSACFAGGTLGIATIYDGILGTVAAAGENSATFWAYSPNNWEVLGKILDGCGINNHYWLFGAAAGTKGYYITAGRFAPTGGGNLGVFYASNEPIVNLQLLSCS